MDTAIGNIEVNATDTILADRVERDFKTAEAVFEEVKAFAVADSTLLRPSSHGDLYLWSRRKPRNLQGTLGRTGDGTAVFEGTVEYQILNQKTVDNTDTHTGITTIDDELAIILNEGLTGTDGPTVVYDGDHVREDAPSHTGEVSFDAATYNVADEVTVILVDPDLNIDADGIDIYTVDAAVGDKTELLSLEIGGCTTVDGFDALSMRETTDDSGTFEGSFDVPSECNGSNNDGRRHLGHLL